MPQTYEEAHRYLQHGRYGSPANPKLSADRPMYYMTRLHLPGQDIDWVSASERPDIAVQHWQTDIVTFHPDDTVTICDGGWASVSTMQRISYHAHHFIPGGSVFRRKNSLWFQETVGETPIKTIKCPECHYHVDPETDDAHIILRLKGGLCIRCSRTSLCGRCQQTGYTQIGGIVQYRPWDGGPTRFSRGGREEA